MSRNTKKDPTMTVEVYGRGSQAAPSETWKGKTGDKAVVKVYTKAAEAELFLNNQPLKTAKPVNGCAVFKVKYRPGGLRAETRDPSGSRSGLCSLSEPAGADTAKPDVIRPGKIWLDENGRRIQAHGACVYFEDGVYYWIGEDKAHTAKKGKTWTWGVRCYSSRDLCSWTDRGHIVKPNVKDTSSVFHPNRRLDRPHILKNERTGKYVLWLKYCDKAHATVLIADHLSGPYTIVKEEFHPYGTKFGDFDLAKDEATGQGYLYFEADHDKVLACRLSDDYCDVCGDPVTIYKDQKPPYTREGITHLHRGGKHYLLSSGMTGYVPNPSECAVADDWLGPYTVQGDPHVNDASSASFNSQISSVFKVDGKDLYIVVADRWVPGYVMTAQRYDILRRAVAQHSDRSVKVSFKEKMVMLTSPMMGNADTSVADYVWLPIQFDGDRLKIEWKDAWNPQQIGMK